MKKKLGVAAVAVAIGVAILSTLSPSASYYVDCIGGSDTNTGTSVNEAWETLAPVHAMDFAPGDAVHFNRGCTWTGKLVIDDDGEENNPITFTSYGTGDRPVFSNPGDPDNWTRAVDIVADWVIVEGLLVRDAHRTGVRIEGDHNVVRDVEVTDTGSGISVRGSHNLITRNYIHDLNMVKNTPGGNDDFGAEGIKFYAPYNEASHNRMENCAAPSYDYGVDGGGFVLLSNSDGTYIHHNWIESSDGFLEVGMGSARDVVVAYNVSVNNEIFSWLHLTGTFGAEVENFRVENNTIVEAGNISRPFGFSSGEIDHDTFSLYNNIIYAPQTYIVSNRTGFAHGHNLYFIGGATFYWDPAVEFNPTEIIADPLFVDLAGKDFYLQHNSPAVDAGVGLGHTEDFEGNLVPAGIAPDVGAFEYQTPAPQPTLTPWYNICPPTLVCPQVVTYTPCPVPTCRPVPTCAPLLPTSTSWPIQPGW